MSEIPVKVLAADDDKASRFLVSRTIAEFCEVDTAVDGRDALELFKKNKYDILLTDIYMPNMNGLDLIQHCKELYPDLKVAIISAFEEVQTMQRAIELKVDKYITKPYDAKKLKSTMEELIDLAVNQHALYIANQHNNALLHSFIVTKTDKEGHITYANDKFTEISGYTLHELLGRNHNIIRHPEMPAFVFENLWATIKQKNVWQGVIKNRAKDGRSFIAQSMIFPILDEDGEIVEFMAIRQDITELEKLRIELETHEREAQKNREEKKLLEEINKTKDSFLVLFTHELKTPLNSIINFSEYMLKLKQDTKEQKLLASIHRNSKDMVEMVNNILDIAKIKSDKLKMQFERVDIGRTLNEIVKKKSEKSELEGVDMVLNCQEKLLAVTDLYRFSQIIENLISNSLKYGKGRIKINASKDKDRIIVSIEDNGGGIKDKTRVFGLFEQEGSYLHKNEKGTGVGLSLVKMLSDMLGFEVYIEDSKELGGARVVLRIGLGVRKIEEER